MSIPGVGQIRTSSRLLAGASALSRLLAAFAGATGAVALLGWILDIPELRSMLPGLVAMNPATAICFILGGLSLLLAGRSEPVSSWLGAGCALAVALLGLVKASGVLFGFDVGLDHVLFEQKLAGVGGAVPNRMAPNTAVAFFLVGSALALQHRGRGPRAAQLFAWATVLLSLLALVGYLFRVRSFYDVPSFIPMALNTALAFFALALGTLLARAKSGYAGLLLAQTAGGVLARRLLPAAVAIPVVLGWLRLEGQRAGHYGTEFGASLQVVSMIAIFSLLIWWTARRLDRSDRELRETLKARRRLVLERTSALEALRESEERLQAILDNAPVVVYLKDLAGRFLFVNRRFEQVFRVEKERILGRTNEEVFSPETADRFRRQDLLAGADTVEMEEVVPQEDGPHTYLSVRFPLRSLAGAPDRLCSISTDITQRKRAEEALQRLAAIVESSEDAIVGKTLDGMIVSWNKAAERIYGYTEEEVLGRPTSILVPPDRPDELPALLEKVRGGERIEHFETVRLRKDGTRIDVALTVSPIRDAAGRVTGASSLARDITERKRAEEEINSFFNLALEGLCIAGFDGYFKRLNPVWEKTLGLSIAELVSKPFIDFVHPDDRAATIAEAQKLSSQEHETVSFTNRYVCADGSYKWLLWNAKSDPVRRLIYAAARDVTEEKRTQEEIRQLNEQLARRVQELDALNGELEAFSYSVSHDLRAPLRHITGFSDLLKAHAKESLDDKGRRYLTTISEAARRMGNLIDDLLVFSRMGRAEMRMSRVDLRQLVENVQRELAHEAAGRDVAWRVNGLPEVRADPAMLRLVLVNLLSNAVKYTRPRERAEIEIGTLPGDEKETVVFVRDNGVGFDMRYVDKLFGVFQRLHRAEEFEGTGIGLANVRRIIQRHGGRTWAEGAVGAGSTFYFSLPRPEREETT